MCSQRTSTLASLRFRRIAGLIIVPILPPNNAHSILASATGLSAHPISMPSPPKFKFCAPFEYALSSSVFFFRSSARRISERPATSSTYTVVRTCPLLVPPGTVTPPVGTSTSTVTRDGTEMYCTVQYSWWLSARNVTCNNPTVIVMRFSGSPGQ